MSLLCGAENVITAVIIVIALSALLAMIMIAKCYKKCPADKIMVVCGAVGKTADGKARSFKCFHGGAVFVWPFVQAYSFLDLEPISVLLDLKNALCRDNVRIDILNRFTVGISTEEGVMQNAAERLLGLKPADIQNLAQEIILGQLRLVIALMHFKTIDEDREKFLKVVEREVENELKKIGLRLINAYIVDCNAQKTGY